MFGGGYGGPWSGPVVEGRRPRKEIRREPGPGAKPDEWDG